ncbi:MAG: ATP-binding protein [Phototrophicaceae bacterium]
MSHDNPPVTDAEIASLRSTLQILRAQVNSQQVDPAFFNRQFDKFDGVLRRLLTERSQSQHPQRYAALHEVSKALGASLDLQTVLDQVMDAIIQLTGAERGFLMLSDDDGNLAVKAARNFDQQTLSGDEFQFSRTVANQVIDTGDPILTTNASEDPRFASQRSIVSQSLRGIMATPLRARERIIGAIYVDSRATTGLFSEADLDTMQAFSAQASIALENAMLFSETDEALSRRVHQLRQLRRIDLLLSETMDIEQVTAHALEWAMRLTDASGGCLALLDNDRLLVNRAHGLDIASGALMKQHFPQVVDVCRSRQTLLTPDTLIVPMLHDQAVTGMVALVRDSGTFSDEQRDLLERVMTRAAVSVENARLYAAAQAADQAKSEFVGVVAHDLKAPMTSIKGYADLLMMEEDINEEQRSYVQQIISTVDRMVTLVQDLSDISRIESGHFYMEKSLIPVDWVTQTVRDTVMPEITARGHTYVEDIAPDLPPIWADYYRIVQVLTNLVSNAYKYTPNGGTITLSAWQDGDRVAFSVTDNGIGMTPDEVAMLGTRFWRSPSKFTRSQPGTGLGFAITRSLVEQMGSRIEVESAPGKGSRFSFRLPTADPAG